MSGTLQRLERVLTMVPWLLQEPGLDLDEIADRFGTTPEEVAADLDTLGYCGLPGYGGGDLVEVSVVAGRVTVRMADFFARPLRLSLREAVTLLLAGRALAAVPGMPESATLHSALDKLQSAVGPGIDRPRFTADLSAPGDEHIQTLHDAVIRRVVVDLQYWSASRAELTARQVEPAALSAAQGAWYLHAYCRAAHAPRAFRLDRIKALRVTDEPCDTAVDIPLHAPAYEPTDQDIPVVLDVDPGARWLPDMAVVDRWVVRRGRARVHLRARSVEWAARLVVSLAPDATVVSPPEVAERARELAGHALSRYRNASGSFP